MLQSIVTWFLGGGLATLTGALKDAYAAHLAAENDAAKLAAQERIEFLKQQIALATAAVGDRWWSTRELIGKCALIYVAKIIVWDTVLKLGETPYPGPQVTGIVMTVIGFYFGSKAVTDVAGRLLSRK